MTGRRKAERRSGQWVHFVVSTDDKRSDGDRREFLRRFSDLGAELEAVQHRASGREALIGRMKLELAARGVKA